MIVDCMGPEFRSELIFQSTRLHVTCSIDAVEFRSELIFQSTRLISPTTSESA